MMFIEVLANLERIPGGVYPNGAEVFWNSKGRLCDPGDAPKYKAYVGDEYVQSTSQLGSYLDPDGIIWVE